MKQRRLDRTRRLDRAGTPGRNEIALVYTAGLAQGLALVTPPAAGGIFTAAEFHGLSSGEYGSLFLPLVVAAVLASGSGGPLAQRWRVKPVLLVGLGLNVAAMGILAASSLFIANHTTAYGTLLAAMAALGAGFGFTITALNAYGVGFFPQRSDVALTALHGVLGTGTALAPLFVALLTGTGVWWLLPAGLVAGFGVIGLSAAALPLKLESVEQLGPRARGSRGLSRTIPGRLWWFGAVAVMYGVSETAFGNWAVIYLREDAGLTAQGAGLGLASFWAMVTVGRLAVAALSVRVSARGIYRGLPVLLFLAFIGIPRVSGTAGNIMAFGFAGLACSALLPLSISFAGRQFVALAGIVSGGMMAAYMIGYGIASFGIGALRQMGDFPLATIYSSSSVLAVVLFLMMWALVKSGQAATRVAERPAG